MNLPGETANHNPSAETDRRDALRWEISQLLVAKSEILIPLRGKVENDRLPIIRVLGGSMKFPDRVRPAQIGLVNIAYFDMLSGESTTISIDERQYQVDGSEARRIDEHTDDPSEEDVVQIMYDIVTPHGGDIIITWDRGVSRMKAAEQIEIHPSWDWTANYN